MQPEQQKALAKLAKESYQNANFSIGDTSGDDVIRNMVNKALHTDESEDRYYQWQRHKLDVFEIMKVAIDAVIPTIITNQFDSLADVRNVAMGDKPRFEITDPKILRVGYVSAGNLDTRRQTLSGKNFTVDTDWKDVKVYTEFEKFLAGNINWSELCQRVATAFTNEMGTKIYTSFQSAYDLLGANVKATGDYDEDKLLNIAEHLRTQTGADVQVYGTITALRKVTKGADMSDNMRDEKNKTGYLSTVAGIDLIQLPQAYKRNKEEFALDDKSLLIVPKGQKLVSVVMEGNAIVDEPDNMTRNDMQLGFQTQKKYGVQVAKMAKYGMYKVA